MKVLEIDIETAPNRVYTWGLWKQNVAINQIEEPGYTLCFAASWQGEKKIHFASVYHDGKDKMIERAFELMDEADAIVHYNGTSFDIPTLNREFIVHGYTPPAPAKQIDLYLTVRKRFNFQSNKLDFVAQQLGLEGKVAHKGMELWRGCMAGDPAAWKIMRKYNIQDVKLLKDVYERLQPWVQSHPNRVLYGELDGDALRCPHCGSENLQRRGYTVTKVARYARHHCQDCGAWSRERLMEKDNRDGVLTT